MTKVEQFVVAVTQSSPGPWRYSKTFAEVTASPHGYVEGSKRVADFSTFAKAENETIANAQLLILAKELGPGIIAALDVIHWIARNPGAHPENIHREAVAVTELFK